MKRAWLIVGLAAGCASPRLVVQQMEGTQTLLEEAAQRGAQECAPVAYAQASSLMDIAQREMKEGIFRAGRSDLERANDAAKQAVKESVDCKPTEAVIVHVTDEKTDTDEDGVVDRFDHCIDRPEDADGFQDEDGCPEIDNDGDGVLDTDDACVNVMEDMDAFQDADGCPDPDNDGDGLPDVADACPRQAGTLELEGCPDPDTDGDGVVDRLDRCGDEQETMNDYLDEDGCADHPPMNVRLTSTRITLNRPLVFALGRATLLLESKAVLGDVFQVLMDAPHLRIRVEGHTDSQGNEEKNLSLSQARAEAVVAHLVQLRVDKSRMEAIGFGPSRPVDTNRTQTGRSNNRRVELHIIR